MSVQEPTEPVQDGESKPEKQGDIQRRVVSEAERIQALRERLYARGKVPAQVERHSLRSDISAPENRIPEEQSEKLTVPMTGGQDPILNQYAGPSGQPEAMSSAAEAEAIDASMRKKRSRSFRYKLALFGIVFFLGAIAVSAFYLRFGNNIISGQNITLSAIGPLSVSGGGELSFQVAVANQNTLPIESATLIIEYPRGVQSATEQGKELFTVRQPLQDIGTGDTVNIPLKVIVFGEENEEKEIRVSIEYRISGSGAILEKSADPFKFKVSSSPVTISVDSLKRISSGQELELTMTVTSNSSSELTDLIVKASYPYGFDFDDADPKPISGEDTWSVASLKPGEKKSITARGIVTGKEDDSLRFTVSAGVGNGRDRYTMVSTLANVTSDVVIEQPFLNVEVTVNTDRTTGGTTVIRAQERAIVGIRFENTLDTSIFNAKIRAELSGNALNEILVDVNGGFYDSLSNTITWDAVDTPSLKEIGPGKVYEVSFSLTPRKDVGRNPELRLKVTTEGQRIFDDRVPQELVGIAEKTIKIEGVPKLYNSIVYTEGPFTNTGPVPPIAEEVTQYTILLTAQAGSNDLTNGVVTAVLPQYVKWLDLVSSGDTVSYEPTTRTMRWNIGNMNANSREEAWVQIAVTPSLTQVGRTPVIVETQRFSATDRYTGTTVRDEFRPLNTELEDEPDPTKRDGEVQRP